jgi:drug/metabolite transporter (DMT)-like permease
MIETPGPEPQSQIRIWAAFAAASLAWGSTGVATRAALNDGIPPITLTTIRAVIATVVLVAVMVATRRPMKPAPSIHRLGWMMAVFNLSLPFALTTFAFRYASAGFVGFIIALIPLATALLAHYLLPDEPMHLPKILALTIALMGVALLLLSGDSGLAEGGRPLLAAALTTGAVISIAYAGVYAKRVSDSYDPIALTTLQFGLGAVLLIVAMLISEGVPTAISTWGWVLMGYLSTFGAIVPFVLYYWILRHVTSTRAATIGYLVPLVALGLGIVLLDEQLQLGLAVGGLLILIGVMLTGMTERITAERVARR